jgi:uncharacterized membrane-anchored protein YitT (DUF2179 family)
VKNILDFVFNTFLLSAGAAICAISVNGILIPQGFLSSGMTGVTLAVFYKFPVISVGIMYLIVNIPVFIIGLVFVGLRFVLYSLWGMVLYSAMLFIFNFRIGIEDKMLAAVIAGGLNGVGVAVMLKSYGAPGGSEILSVIMNKFFSITLGAGGVIINAVVLLVSCSLYPLDKILYTVVYIIISMWGTDYVFHGLSRRQAALIISDKWEDILQELTEVHKIGVTLLHGRGGYHGNKKMILYTVINRRMVSALKKTTTDIDPNVFISIINASDVTGVEVGNQPRW